MAENDVIADAKSFSDVCSQTVGQWDVNASIAENWGANGSKLQTSINNINNSALNNYQKAVRDWNKAAKDAGNPDHVIATATPSKYGTTLQDWNTPDGSGLTANIKLIESESEAMENALSQDFSSGVWAAMRSDGGSGTDWAPNFLGVTYESVFGGYSEDQKALAENMNTAFNSLKDANDALASQARHPHATIEKCGEDMGKVDVTEEGCLGLNIATKVADPIGTAIELTTGHKNEHGIGTLIKCPDLLTADDAAKAAAEGAKLAAAAAANPGAVAAAVTFDGLRDFKEQCFLLAKIFDLAQYKKETFETTIRPKRLPYIAPPPGSKGATGNACLMADGDPYAFVNKLTQHPHQKVFFDMQNKDISTLMPMIRLYKINTDGGKETQQEYSFQSNTTYDELERTFHTKGKRGYGVGVKDFSFVYDGNNPFAAKKSIKAKLTIFANSFDELLEERDPLEKGGSVWSYIELALKTGKGTAATDKKGKTAEEIKKIEDNLSKLNFRLKAIVGWAKPNGNLNHFGEWEAKDGAPVKKTDLLDAIYDSHMTLNLTPVTHEFNLDDMGRVNFVISYLAYVDDFFDQSGFNIFSNIEINKKMLKRKMRYKTLTKECKAEEVAKIKKQELEQKEVKLEKQKGLQSIIQELFDKDYVKYIEISYTELLMFESQGPYFETGGNIAEKIIDPSLIGGVEKSLLDHYAQTQADAFTSKEGAAADNERNFAVAAANPNNNSIPFFYASDLMDVILGGIENKLEKLPSELGSLSTKETVAATAMSSADVLAADPATLVEEDKEISKDDIALEKEKLQLFQENFKKFRLLLGPLEIVNPKNGAKSLFVNFGDVPISVKYFVEWMTDKLLKKDETTYSLSKFLSDFFNDLIKNFLNDSSCFEGVAKQKARLNQSVVTSYRDAGITTDEFTAEILKKHKFASRGVLKNMKQPVLNVSGPTLLPISNPGVDREINYMVFYAGRTQPTELMQGNRGDDENRGIFHYMLGKNRGIVKKIDLSKTTSTGLREVRFEQEGYDGLEQLREVYDVNLTTYANVKAWPGTYIYIDPHGWSPMATDQDLTRLGIGGYCMVIRSEHSFGPGQAESKITAKWVASTVGDLTTSVPDKEEEEGTEKQSGAGTGTNSTVNCNQSTREEGLMDGWMEKLASFAGIPTGASTEDGSLPQPGEGG